MPDGYLTAGLKYSYTFFAMEVTISGIDAHRGLDLFEGDVEAYVDILRSYVRNTPVVLGKMRTVSEETLRDYAAAVHGLKSVSDSIGAETARKNAKQLEDLAKGGDLAGILVIHDSFIKYVDKLVENIQIWLEKYDSLNNE